MVGWEVDVGWARNKDTLTSRIPGVSIDLNTGSFVEVKGTWDASLRFRGGYLVTPTVLSYLTGGLAYQRIEAIATCPADTDVCDPAAGTQSFKSVGDRLGWTAGAGLEMMLSRTWLVRAEYRYAKFDFFSFTAIPATPTTYGGNASLATATHTAQVGVAYRFK